MAELYQLPDGWELLEWKNVVNIKNGKDYKSVLNPNGQYPIYGSGGIINYADEYLCKENSIIIGRKGTINNPLFVKEKFWNIDTAFGIESNEEYLLPMFLFYFSQQFNFLELNTSTTLPSLTKTNLQQIKIPLPPLKEQKRIVSKLDTLFEKIDKSISLHQKNIDEANVFMASVLNDVFVELEEKYEIKTLNDVCYKITDGTHSSPKTTESGYPYITVRDVTDKGKIDFDNCEFVNEIDFQRLKDGNCAPIKNDVLFSKDGTVGKVTVVDFQKDFVVLSSLAILRPSNNLNSYFLFYTMKSPKFFEFAQSQKTGAAIKRVVLRTIKEFEIPLPPLQTQQKVVAYLDEISQKLEKIKQLQKEKMAHLKALKASILDSAFRGEL